MALMNPRFDGILLDTLRTLHGYLDRIVLVGGCANVLYRHVPDARSSKVPLLLTYDIDFAAAASLPRCGESLSVLLQGNGFLPAPAGRPTNKYRLADGGNESIEFLCPMMGLPTVVKDSRPALVTLPADAMAEALDYLDLLLLDPLSLNLRQVSPLALEEDLVVQIPNPASYVIQKALIHSRRADGQKRAKDSFYIYETMLLFRAPGQLQAAARCLAGRFPAKWGRDFSLRTSAMFGHENGEGVQEAIRIAQSIGLPVDAAMVSRTVQKQLAEIEAGLGLR